MKRKLFIFLILLTSSFTIGCSMQQNDKTDTINKVTSMPNNKTNTATIGPSYSEARGIVANIKEGSLSNVGMEICIENNSDAYFYSFGQGNDTIEKKIGGQWKETNIIEDEIATFDVLWNLRPGDTMEYKAYWRTKYGKLLHGEYRFKKEVIQISIDGIEEKYCLYLEFTLEL